MKTIRKPLCQGFTLTELMVALAVLAILVVIAVPSFSNMVATQATRNASFDLSSAMAMARSEAVKQNAIATVSTTSNWATGWVLTVNATVVRTFGPYSGVTITSSSSNPLSLSFGNDGRPTAGTSTFQVTPSGQGQSVSPACVQVGGTGRVAIVSGVCS
ncbi:general secretion pathway protein GspH [Ralstonia sp. A12]|uniref:GspH/FimT family pseudopilin n=1 Tax=Ralstonia sp. A12 TaxID=1217052 RepID=UPI000573FF13|nr:GspH/FimT family pseudopilin [Ralstonia sp. A12]KHK50648.1 general secretion pathway protein GspH [Ralstonia sp. A12]